MLKLRKATIGALLAASLVAGAVGANAQQMQHGPGMMGPGMMGPGMYMGYGTGNMPTMGPGMMGPGMHMGYGMGNMPMMGPGMMGQMAMGGVGDINSYADTRATYLKAQLGITEPQASVWNAYLGAFRAHLTAMQQHHQAMMTGMVAGITSAQRANAMVASMDACHKAITDLKTAYVALYQALTPEQKQRADALFVGMNWMM
jgi:hypothetical protein